MSIIESAKEASRQRLRPILMTSFAFVMGVLPMARATGAGAYSRNSLGIVIAFGIAVSTVLGRFVIPIYYVLGERLHRLPGPARRGRPRRCRPPTATAGSPAPRTRTSSRWSRAEGPVRSERAHATVTPDLPHRRGHSWRSPVIREGHRVVPGPGRQGGSPEGLQPGLRPRPRRWRELGKDAIKERHRQILDQNLADLARPRTCSTPRNATPYS